MSRIGDLLRQLAIAYDDLQIESDERFNLLSHELENNRNQLLKIKSGLKSIVSSLEYEGDKDIDFNQERDL